MERLNWRVALGRHDENNLPLLFASAAGERISPHCVARPVGERYDRDELIKQGRRST